VTINTKAYNIHKWGSLPRNQSKRLINKTLTVQKWLNEESPAIEKQEGIQYAS
jgi:hypothetical protein